MPASERSYRPGMRDRIRKNKGKLHPSLRSARLRRHLEQVVAALRASDPPLGFERRDAERGDEADDEALLDLLTVALDLADDRRVQTLAAYARTSIILALTRSRNR